MAERITTEARLARILYMLPIAAREGGARLEDLARALDIPEREVLRDLEEVTARAYYHSAGAGDDLQIEIESDRVTIWTKGEFHRPVRLSPREALALGLGLRALAAEAEPSRRAALLELATRLEASLAVPPIESHALPGDGPAYAARGADGAPAGIGRSGPAGSAPAPSRLSDVDRFAAVLADDEDFLSVVVEAARTRRTCRIRYLKPGAPAPEDREVHPYHLVHAEGRWYLLAFSAERRGLRIFRMDRILEAEPLDGSFEVLPDFDPARYIAEGGKLFFADDDIEVAVRYSRRIARWIEERTACERCEDGSVVVRHRVADPRWVVRHVLQYGADAEVVEPDEVRGMVREAAERVAG